MSQKIANHQETISLAEARIRSYRSRIDSHQHRVAELERRVAEAKQELVEEHLYVASCPGRISEAERQISAARDAIIAERAGPTVNAIVRLQTKIAAMSAGLTKAERAELTRLLSGEPPVEITESLLICE